MVIFRVDGNPYIGMGHVMRCLSIADAYKEIGTKCVFVSADNSCKDIINCRGYQNSILNTKYDNLEGEIEHLIKEIHNTDAETVYIDSYFVTDEYMSMLTRHCKQESIKIVYIDDVMKFPYLCDILLNYNIYADINEYNKLYKNNWHPTFLLNTSYVPLRKEFQEYQVRICKRNAKDILISTGGSDFEHMGVEFLRMIENHKEWASFCFHLVIGMMSKDKEEIYKIAMRHNNIILYEKISYISELMLNCDVAISAAGSTLYELCATQTPTVTYVLADNQIPGATRFDGEGIMKYAGDIRMMGAEKLSERLLAEATKLVLDYEKRDDISRKMKMIVDGYGSRRIVSAVEGNA